MDPSWEFITVEIGTEAAQFPETEYINGIFVAVVSTCLVYTYKLQCIIQCFVVSFQNSYGNLFQTYIAGFFFQLSNPVHSQSNNIILFNHYIKKEYQYKVGLIFRNHYSAILYSLCVSKGKFNSNISQRR